VGREEAGSTAMTIFPSILTTTDFASSFPGMWAEAAIF